MKIKTSVTMGLIRQNKEYFESASKTPLVITSRTGQFILCSYEHAQSLGITITESVNKTKFIKDPGVLKRAIHRPVIVTNKSVQYALIHDQHYVEARRAENEQYEPDDEFSIATPTKVKKEKFVPLLSKRVGAARAWDDHAFLEADGMWTDVREEIVKLEEQIKILEQKLADI